MDAMLQHDSATGHDRSLDRTVADCGPIPPGMSEPLQADKGEQKDSPETRNPCSDIPPGKLSHRSCYTEVARCFSL